MTVYTYGKKFFPTPRGEHRGEKANYTPHDIEQRELLGHVEYLARTAIPSTLVHFDPLSFIEFE